jgi:phosphatidate cytidylyltransferase
MLKHRLLFGTLMTLSFTGIVCLDGWLDGSLTPSSADNKVMQATLLYILIAAIMILAQIEFSNLAAAKGLKSFTFITTTVSILLAGAWYWPQLAELPFRYYLFFLLTFALLGLLLRQYIKYGTSGVLANCGVSFLSIIYLGLLAGFVLAIRIDFGPLPLLMFVFTIKSSDIGAYTIGTLFGKLKFSPNVSPSKTWEGMAAAAITAAIVALVFASICGIMVWWLAVVFGLCFAFVAQIGDLIESMIKRDAEQKDSANKVPGFGGVLDVIDSPLVAAPFTYLYFVLFLQP